MKSNPEEQAEHEPSHQLLKIESLGLLSQSVQELKKNIEPVMDRFSDVVLEVLLTECPRGHFALQFPLFAIAYEDAGPVESAEGVTCECSADVVLAVVFLNMLEVCWVVDDV